MIPGMTVTLMECQETLKEDLDTLYTMFKRSAIHTLNEPHQLQ